MNEPEKLGIQIPVLRTAWDQRTPDDEKYWAMSARALMARAAEVVGEIERDVSFEPQLEGGLRLFGKDEHGNEVPEYVMLRYTAMARRRAD